MFMAVVINNGDAVSCRESAQSAQGIWEGGFHRYTPGGSIICGKASPDEGRVRTGTKKYCQVSQGEPNQYRLNNIHPQKSVNFPPFLERGIGSQENRLPSSFVISRQEQRSVFEQDRRMAHHHSPLGANLGRAGPSFPSIFGPGSLEEGVIPVDAFYRHKKESNASARFLKKNGVADGKHALIHDALARLPMSPASAFAAEYDGGVYVFCFRIRIPCRKQIP